MKYIIVILIIFIGISFWSQKIPEIQEREISFEGVVVNEPERRINKVKYEVEGIPGKVLITSGLYPQYGYGDKLKITGKLKKPVDIEDFDYQKYLAKDKIYSVIYYPKIELIDEGSGFYHAVFNFKNKLRGNIEKVLLPPQGSILKAVLLGDKHGISNELKEKLSRTGTSHIVAISGMHMVIVSEIILFLLLFLGLWRQQAFYFVLILLAGYIIIIGVPASAVRAGIMIGLLLLAQQTGRLQSSVRPVLIAACLMLLFNPLLLIDVGFQLSFAAVLSIIYLKPIFDGWLGEFPLKDILTLTLAAQTGVLPILVWHFGQVSLISPLANILIVPFLPFLMIGGLIVVILPFKILAYPLWLLLSLIIWIIDILALVPILEIKYFSWVFFIGWYLGLIVIYKKNLLNLVD